MLKAHHLIAACCTVFALLSTAYCDGVRQTRLVKGKAVNINKYPFEVSVRRRFCDSCTYNHYCGGAILKENVIITSSACVRGAQAGQTFVVAGSSFRESLSRMGSIVPVERFTIYPDEMVDLALIHLRLPIPLNGFTTKAVNLGDLTPRVGAMGIVACWGQVSETDLYSDELREIKLPIFDHETCSKLYFWHNVTENELCAGYKRGGLDACYGDAGSPLLVNGQMAGIVSWGWGCARPNNPGVYTNVVYFRNWILAKSESI